MVCSTRARGESDACRNLGAGEPSRAIQIGAKHHLFDRLRVDVHAGFKGVDRGRTQIRQARGTGTDQHDVARNEIFSS